jgi:hypothetical protein
MRRNPGAHRDRGIVVPEFIRDGFGRSGKMCNFIEWRMRRNASRIPYDIEGWTFALLEETVRSGAYNEKQRRPFERVLTTTGEFRRSSWTDGVTFPRCLRTEPLEESVAWSEFVRVAAGNGVTLPDRVG